MTRSKLPPKSRPPEDPVAIGLRTGKSLNKRKMAKHFTLDIVRSRLSWHLAAAPIDAEVLTEVDEMVTLRGGLPDRRDGYRLPARATGFRSGHQRSAACAGSRRL